jgi:hypothetical protein
MRHASSPRRRDDALVEDVAALVGKSIEVASWIVDRARVVARPDDIHRRSRSSQGRRGGKRSGKASCNVWRT